MATLAASSTLARQTRGHSMHQFRLGLAIAAAAGLVLFLTLKGGAYYRASAMDRSLSPLHAELRSSGVIGLRLGVLGLTMFGVIFALPLRKRWRWLSELGNTRHWLDFHVFMGITAPIVISFHATFHWHGLAGLAYWIMIAISISGFIGRYIYAKIPRGVKSARLSARELEAQTQSLTEALYQQNLFHPDELDAVLRVPSSEEIRKMRIARLMWTLICTDVSAPFKLSRLRRRVLSRPQRITTLGGFLAGGDAAMESIIGNVRRQFTLRTKAAFLERTEKIFHLWHVVHRPFSISFAVLVVVHVAVALSLGYY